jgi:hypothetical protein
MIRIGAGSGDATRYVSKKASPSHQVFNETKPVGPAALSKTALLRACRNAHKPWIKCEKYFREAYKRAKQGRIPGVRTQADLCRLIGCSIRWLQLVLAGTAADSNKHRKDIKNPELGSDTAEPKKDEDYADDITRYPQRELESLMDQDPERYRELCAALAGGLRDAANRIQPRVQSGANKGARV